MKKRKSKSDNAGGLVFVGSLLIGVGLGMYYNNAGVGALIGLGTGFILFGLVKVLMRD